ncbi:hypothetical protein MMYC01_204082 [Madurella mycetomatis]|uniref:Uncharacterized protein n=1 Tax=Madurella mycetomatis TaxID=100816 RepID=A0A175WBX9_9PEZI|nr:hypothetical protein MMYC01_204082 [Madurella mycetomatis]
MSSAGELILQHSQNFVDNPLYVSYTDKPWARSYLPMQNLSVHSTVDQEGTFHATFDPAFLPLGDDEEKRAGEAVHPPNHRFWRLETEADMEHWWHTEISDIVLAAWARYPAVVQTCHTNPLRDVSISENVDSTYGVYIGNQRFPVAIGEVKRNLISPSQWQSGNLVAAQQKLARELRGYADKYECPHIFCWDGQTLLILQFRARKPEHIRNADCPIDCWVIPVNGSTCTLRYALYRLMVQGFRRCQAVAAAKPLSVGTLTEHGREFFTGRPIWRVGGQSSINHPEGYLRSVDGATGGLYWGHPMVEDTVWETGGLWE